MLQNQLTLSVRLAWIGFFLSIGLVSIAAAVEGLQRDLTFSLHTIKELYANNPVQWIILTSPFFLTVVFYWLGKRIQNHETKIEQRAAHEHMQFTMLEKFIGQMEADNLSVSLPQEFSNRSLATRLEQFRGKLISNKADAQQRLWEKDGLTQLADLIRGAKDVEKLSDDVIRFLVKYTESNQGSIFLARGEGEDVTLEQTACYAYMRKKFGQRSIPAGNGLVGQCYLEKETTVLYSVPKDYIKITSGLGESLPTCVIIVPMKLDGIVNGVIEVASFKKLESYQIAFLEKACHAFASVVDAATTADRMKILLNESQIQTEELKAQEEEMRQNMEEMQSIQEAMTRQLEENARMKKDLEAREKVLAQTTILSESDLFGTITFVNSKFCEVSQYTSEELIGKGHNVLRHPEMPKELFQLMWSTIKRGEIFRGVVKNRKKDGTHYWVDATVVPIFEKGKIVKYIGARYHIEDERIAQKLFQEQCSRLRLLHNGVELNCLVA